MDTTTDDADGGNHRWRQCWRNDPADSDTDKDGNDGDELTRGTDPADFDLMRIVTDWDEVAGGTDPTIDSDDDGVSDGEEVSVV